MSDPVHRNNSSNAINRHADNRHLRDRRSWLITNVITNHRNGIVTSINRVRYHKD